MKIAVSGASGLIGTRLIELLKDKHEIIPLGSQECDITDLNSVSSALKTLDFDVLVHLAAYTNVDGAEIEKDKAYKLNVDGTKNIFETCLNLNKKMIYISTDFVFDGKKPPYDELTVPNPLGYYAKTKFEGEKIVKNKAMIVRISYPFQEFDIVQPKPDFIHRLVNIFAQKKQISMMFDAAITPTFIDDIVYGIEYLCENFKPEIFHLVGGKTYTPYEIGQFILKKLSLDESLVQKTTFKEYSQGKTERPQYSIILSSKNNFHRMKSLEEVLNI
jgi:dTDP-4-dehydrorhamnose reductase